VLGGERIDPTERFVRHVIYWFSLPVLRHHARERNTGMPMGRAEAKRTCFFGAVNGGCGEVRLNRKRWARSWRNGRHDYRASQAGGLAAAALDDGCAIRRAVCAYGRELRL